MIAPHPEPQFVTFINPSFEKGVVLVARLVHEMAQRRPDIPFLVAESRGTAANMQAAANAGGFDLRDCRNVRFLTAVGLPRNIYHRTKVLIVPSVWEEPAGRVAVEAMMNGISPIVSDRGGLPEVCNGGGTILAIPPEITPLTRTP